MTDRPATPAEIRKSYKQDGYEVQIRSDGQVIYRPDRDYQPGSPRIWLYGRYVEDYWTVDGKVELS